ncbi:RmlC-like cupin domain-containing protein [Phlyctochytrium arcticum]|nr:RmlC-like cupin domain-containing protein [Phlyctochytrium arcticum]
MSPAGSTATLLETIPKSPCSSRISKLSLAGSRLAAPTNPLPPTPHSMAALIDTLHTEVTTPDFSVPRIKQIMESYIPSTADDYLPFAQFDPSKPYTRNLVDDGNGIFNLMILCWSQGKASPIHDHAGAHCLMKILDGELQETQYEWPKSATGGNQEHGGAHADDDSSTSSIEVKKETRLKTNNVAYIHDKIGLHRISNPSETRPAISLHLYSPPFEYCKTFCESTGQARKSGRCVFYRDFSKVPKEPTSSLTASLPTSSLPQERSYSATHIPRIAVSADGPLPASPIPMSPCNSFVDVPVLSSFASRTVPST